MSPLLVTIADTLGQTQFDKDNKASLVTEALTAELDEAKRALAARGTALAEAQRNAKEADDERAATIARLREEVAAAMSAGGAVSELQQQLARHEQRVGELELKLASKEAEVAQLERATREASI